MQHNRNNPTVNAVVNWWVSLHADHGDRGARARLKRCESVFDALLEARNPADTLKGQRSVR